MRHPLLAFLALAFACLAPAACAAGAKSPHAALFYGNEQVEGIREGKWKLIPALGSHGFSVPKQVKPEVGGPEGQLYDLDADPREERNLWSERKDVVARLSSLLESVK